MTTTTPVCDLIERLLLSRDKPAMSPGLSRDTILEALKTARALEASVADQSVAITMGKMRERERLRKAAWRAQKPKNVPGLSRDTSQSIYDSSSKKDSVSTKEVKKEGKILHSSDVPGQQPELFEPAAAKPKNDWPANYRDLFWATYPRRVGKAAATRKLEALAKSGKVSWKTLFDGVGRYVKYTAGTEEQFIKHPATWLNQGCWDDEHKPKGSYNGAFRGPDEKLGFAGLAAKVRYAQAAHDQQAGPGEPASGDGPANGRGDSEERVEPMARNRQAALPAPRAHRG